MSQTYFDHVEDVLSRVEATGLAAVAISEVREAMVKDQHQLFHDAEFHPGCSICDREREEYG